MSADILNAMGGPSHRNSFRLRLVQTAAPFKVKDSTATLLFAERICCRGYHRNGLTILLITLAKKEDAKLDVTCCMIVFTLG